MLLLRLWPRWVGRGFGLAEILFLRLRELPFGALLLDSLIRDETAACVIGLIQTCLFGRRSFIFGVIALHESPCRQNRLGSLEL